MARPLWKGFITFGLVNIPIVLYPAESHFDLHFRMLDSRNNARIRYERINEETGAEVPWQNVVKAYEYNGGNYVVLKDKELEELAVKSAKAIDITDFVAKDSIGDLYFDKPYYLVPDKKGEKAYVLLRETLIATKTVGIAKVMIRTKEYLTAVLPYKNAIILNLLRYDQELRKPTDFAIPSEDIKAHGITAKELELAKRLVDSMITTWDPKHYQDEYQTALKHWIDERIKAQEKGVSPRSTKRKETAIKSNVIDIMDLLKKSLTKKDTKSTKKAVPVKSKKLATTHTHRRHK